MNDDFMLSLQKPPRREFSASLYASLAGVESRTPFSSRYLSTRPHRLRWALAVIGLALVFSTAVLPAARAKLVDVLRQIGGLTYTETEDYPGSGGSVEIVPSRTVTLSEALAELPFATALPAWVPDGFVLQEKVSITEWPESGATDVEVRWLKQLDPHQPAVSPSGVALQHAFFLDLRIQDISKVGNRDYGMIVGPQSVTELQVNGQPAALVRGAWNADKGAWDESIMLFLQWTKSENLVYTLSVSERAMSTEALVRVAESIP